MAENFKQMQTPIGRLLQLFHIRNNRPKDASLEWWKLFVTEFFALKAVVRVSTKVQAGAPPSMLGPYADDFWTSEVPFEALPRVFQVKYENGPQEEVLSLGQCQEIRTQGGYHVLCDNAVEQAFYDMSVTNNYGKLKVSFTAGMKIVQYEFTVVAVDYWLPPQLYQGLHTEVRKLALVLEDCSNRFRQAAASGASVNPAAAQDALRLPTDLARALVNFLEHNVITETPHNKNYNRLLQLADVVNTLGEMMGSSSAKQSSPLLNLQQYGALSEQPARFARIAATQMQMSNEDESKLSVQSTVLHTSPHIQAQGGKLSPLAAITAAAAAAAAAHQGNGVDHKALSPSNNGSGGGQLAHSPQHGMPPGSGIGSVGQQHTPPTPQSPGQQGSLSQVLQQQQQQHNMMMAQSLPMMPGTRPMMQ